MKKLNVYQIILNSVSYSILLTFVLVITEVVKSEFVFVLQSFGLFFTLHFLYQLFINSFLKEKVYKWFHLKKK